MTEKVIHVLLDRVGSGAGRQVWFAERKRGSTPIIGALALTPKQFDAMGRPDAIDAELRRVH